MRRPFVILTILTGICSTQLQGLETYERIWEKEREVFLLGKKNEETVVPLLVAIIQDPDEEIRIKLEAISSLSEIGGDSVHTALVEILQDREDANPVVRSIAAAALGKLQEARSISPLIEVLEDEKEPLVQWKIIEALGRIGTEQSLAVVQEYLSPVKPLRLRKTAIQTLSQTDSQDALLTLSELLDQTDQFEIKLQLIQSLGEMKTDQAEHSLTAYSIARQSSEIPLDKENAMIDRALQKSLKNIKSQKKTL
jgi:HEAT repeat protein